MIAPQAFQVLTEFRFDIGHAVANSSALQSAVGGISSAANDALFSLERLGIGAAASLGLGAGSLLGVLGVAITSADKFGMSQRQFANIISANMDHLTGSVNTFEDRMAASEQIMRNINKLANEFSLPATDLLDTSKLLAATLVPKGLAGTNFSTAIDISRSFLKASPTLGVDSGLARGQLLDMIQGRANLGDTLFQRLMNETAAFKPFNKNGGPQQFNALPAPERVRLVSSALRQFSSDMDVLKGNAMSLSGEMRRLGEAIKGPFSILKPLGDVILVPLLKVLHQANAVLQTQGKEIVKSFAGLLKPFIEDPQALLINLLQLKRLKSDTKLAGEATFLIGTFMTIAHVLHFLGIEAASFRVVGGGLVTFFSLLRTSLVFIFEWAAKIAIFLTGASTIFGALYTILNGLVVVASRVLLPFALILGFFQLISRARAIAGVEDAKSFLTSTPAMAQAISKLSQVFNTLIDPFVKVFNTVAEFISPLFRVSYYFDILIYLVDKFADALILVQAGIEGALSALHFFFNNAYKMFYGQDIMKGVGEAWNAGVDDAIERNLKAIENGSSIVNQVTNIGKVEIQNNFKEQMEPDRIAFTLKEQLLKTARNPGQAQGRSIQGAFAR